MTTLDKLAALGVEFADGQTEPTTTTVEVPDIAALRSLLDLGLDADGAKTHFDAMFAGGRRRGGRRSADRGARGRRRSAERLDPRGDLGHVPAAGAADGRTRADHRRQQEGSQHLRRHTERRRLHRCDDEPGRLLLLLSDHVVLHLRHPDPQRDQRSRRRLLDRRRDPARTPPKPATPGAAGQAQSGGPGQCSSGGIAGPGGGNGTHGQPGHPGHAGVTGGTGIASQAATIMIKNTLTASNLVVHTQSGPGGTGGEGGDGGKGQQGGNGGNGVTCGCTGQWRRHRSRRRHGRQGRTSR